MVYDYTDPQGFRPSTSERGFAIHQVSHESHSPLYELYTDDGRGYGNYVASSSDLYWIRRIAYALDQTSTRDFAPDGNPR